MPSQSDSLDSILQQFHQGKSLNEFLTSPWQTMEVSVPKTWPKVFAREYSTPIHYCRGNEILEVVVENDLNALTKDDKIKRGITYLKLEDKWDLDILSTSYHSSLDLAYERIRKLKSASVVGTFEIALGAYLTYSSGGPIFSLFAFLGISEVGSRAIHYLQRKYAGFSHSLLGNYAPVVSGEKDPVTSLKINVKHGPFLTEKEALKKVFPNLE